MRDDVITTLDQVTPAWLTAVLRRSGALTRGSVASVELGTGQGNWSTNASLIVGYIHDAQGSLPQRLFLKMVDTAVDDDESFGESEVIYYTRDYVDVANAPLVRCYDAVYSKDLNRYHLLLNDVSETHVAATAKAPTLEHGLALAEALAALHARWWGPQRLAEAGASIHNQGHIRNFVAMGEPGVDHILSRFSADLKPHWPETMCELYAKYPETLIRRTDDPGGFTLIHGDAGQPNILVPRHSDRPLYLIDRQPFNWSLTTWLGVYDLAYAIVLDWPTETRRQCEMPILRHYLAHLAQNGVPDYSWEHLIYDYRLCVPMCITIATEFCRGGVNERLVHIWLPMLQRSLTACDDLSCRALW